MKKLFAFLLLLAVLTVQTGCAASCDKPRRNVWATSAIAPIGQSSIPADTFRYKERSSVVPAPGGKVYSYSVQGTDTYVTKRWNPWNGTVHTEVVQRPYGHGSWHYVPDYHYPRTYNDPRGPKSGYVSGHIWFPTPKLPQFKR